MSSSDGGRASGAGVDATLRAPDAFESAPTWAPTADKPSLPTAVDTSGGVDLRDASFASRYEPRAVLGEGGMGEVLLCRDKHVGRDVALKRIRGSEGSSVLERFVREARVQGQLEHPAVVPVHDLGVMPDGRTYFTMKRIRGETLDDVVRLLAAGDLDARARFGRRRLLDAFRAVCLAIDFAHVRGVLHRDLKPANVMLGEFGEVHVLDWGLAKLRAQSESDAARPSLEIDAGAAGATMAGSLMGTPGYMAPEQARGALSELDERTDVYALGAILFELLYLEPVHDGSATARLAATLAPARFEGRAHAADVPPELEAICRQALAVDKTARHASARELASALERYLDGERDEARRRELALEHVTKAEAILSEAARSPRASSLRADAMRELGRALALDPTRAEALAAIERLLTEVPDEVPAEAQGELAQQAMARRAAVLRAVLVRSVTWLVAVPVVMLFGVTSWALALAPILSIALATALAGYVVATRRTEEGWLLGLYGATVGALACMSLVFGPFVLVPGFVVTNAMVFALDVRREVRPWLVALGVLAIALPWAASLVGALPPIYSFTESGEMLIRSPIVQFSPWLTLVFLFATSVTMVVTPTVLLGRFRDDLERAERRVFLSAWHLRQLLPRDAKAGGAP
jgi:serine/threonine-protein kinase